MVEYCQDHRINYEATTPIHHNPMGYSMEDENFMTIMNVVLLNSEAPKNLWGEAIVFVYFILNKIPHKHGFKYQSIPIRIGDMISDFEVPDTIITL